MSDWALFGVAWSAMCVAAVGLSLSGIVVLARGQVILAIAASQAAACGAAAAMYVIGLAGSGHVHGDIRIHFGALCGGLLGTGLAWRGNSERAGWLFALASAGTILLVAQSPYGMHDVLALQHSNALVAGQSELILFSILACLAVGFTVWKHRELRLFAVDPEHAQRCGLPVRRWDRLLGLWLGMVLSLAVSTFGLLATFCWMILPAMIVSRVVNTLWPVLLLAPLVALAATIMGIGIGHEADMPPGQTVAIVLALLLPVAVLASWLKARLKPAA